MRFLSKIFFIVFSAAIFILPAQASDVFIVKDIKVQGLQGISRDTVLSYLPVQVGERFNTSQSADIIRTLYGTGFFSDVEVAQEGTVLIITVKERPVITSVDVTGNKTIPKDKLNDVLKNLGLVQGRVFDNSVLARVQFSLQTEYNNLGKYNAKVDTQAVSEPRGRIAVKIDISEGKTAEVRNIRIIGNHVFKSNVLIRQLTLSTPHIWSFVTRTNQYTPDKLDSSIEALSSYYMDRGYLKFKVDSTQVTLTPDHDYAYVVFHVTEGDVYKVSGIKIVGNLTIPPSKFSQVVPIKAGDVFSRKSVRDATDGLTKILGNMGYAFANVNVVPDVDDKAHTVFLTFYIEPGNRVYVRRISFTGNVKTEDVVLRHSLRQMEGGVVSMDDIKESEHQLNLTGFFDSVHPETKPVPGVPDQVDMNYNVTESAPGQVTAGIGYGSDGFVVTAGVNQNNFLGTGKTVGINFQNSLYSTNYSFNYTNPYYTVDGISRGFSLYAQRVTPGNLNISRYTQNIYGGTMNYSIPLSAKGDALQFGYGYQDVLIKLGSSPSTQLQTFVNSYNVGGTEIRFNQILLNSGWSRNNLDRAMFPTQGLYQDFAFNVGLPGGGSPPLDYYKTNYDINFYQPIIPGFIFNPKGSVGYGAGFGPTKGLPFFVNYYAGGIGYTGAVRGYETNTLGPYDSNLDSLGGNKLAVGTLAIIFPNMIDPEKLRTSVFLDGGNVYSTIAQVKGGSPSGPVRYSTGLSIDWQVPVFNALINVSVTKALNPQRFTVNGQTVRDHTDVFQFTAGTSF